MDDPEPRRAEPAYLARHVTPDGTRIVQIAGLHALGSIGAAHYLTDHLADRWSEIGDVSFSRAPRPVLHSVPGPPLAGHAAWRPVPAALADTRNGARLRRRRGHPASVSSG